MSVKTATTPVKPLERATDSNADAKVGMPFVASIAKITIGSLDDSSLTVSAQYNPNELQVTQAIGWEPHPKKADNHNRGLQYEFGSLASRTMTVELLFDGVENAGKLAKGGAVTVEQAIAKLQKLANPREKKKEHEDWRPHFCVVVWGRGGVPAMPCVIDNLQVKYQRFDRMGRVMRATCTVSLKEARRVDLDDRAPMNATDAWRNAVTKQTVDLDTLDDKKAGHLASRTWSRTQARDERNQNRYTADGENRPKIDEGVALDNSDR